MALLNIWTNKTDVNILSNIKHYVIYKQYCKAHYDQHNKIISMAFLSCKLKMSKKYLQRSTKY